MEKLFKVLSQCRLDYIVLIILLISISARSQAQVSSRIEFFDADELLNITIKTDLKNLINHKHDSKYQKAEFILNSKSYLIRIRSRGNYRLENCNFPPLTLNFSKTEFDNEGDNYLKKLKLVNVCKLQGVYEQYVLREYLIYKVFNLMTDMSFKVRLMKITYEDTKEKMKSLTQYGFVIEDEKMLAERLDGILIKKKGLKDQLTNTEQIIMLSIFQFMMGNTDWQVAGMQNLKLLKLNDFTEPAPYVIPYDFDYTGMVDALYAIPAPVLGIDDIRKRLYWGKCYAQEDLIIALDKFRDKKKAIYQVYENFTFLDKSSLRHSINYLDSFYKIIDNEKRWQHYFIDNCKD